MKKPGKKKPRGPRSANGADKELGQRIRVRRVELDISQSDLAKACGISFQQIQKYEKGINRVGVARLQQIASHLKVPITFFYNQDGGDKSVREVESLLFLDSAFSLRLLRAYSKIRDQSVQRTMVTLMENIVESQPA